MVLILVSSGVLSSLSFTSIEKPAEYVRQDHFLVLKDNLGVIKVNCFQAPAAPSSYFIGRIMESQGKILLKKNLLVCDFDYSQLSSAVVRTVVNSTIWFQNPDAGDVAEKILHLNQTGEQIIFSMREAGDYTFDIWILLPSMGLRENYFRVPNFHVYDSNAAYFAADRNFRVSVSAICLGLVSSISGVILSHVDNRQDSKGKERYHRHLDGYEAAFALVLLVTAIALAASKAVQYIENQD